MHYPEIRTQLRSCVLLLCSGTSWFSWLIQAATGSRWSHVGLILRLERLDRVMLLESVESVGVRAVPLSRYFTNYQQSGAGYPGEMAFYRHRDFPAEAEAGHSKGTGKKVCRSRCACDDEGRLVRRSLLDLRSHGVGCGVGVRTEMAKQ